MLRYRQNLRSACRNRYVYFPPPCMIPFQATYGLCIDSKLHVRILYSPIPRFRTLSFPSERDLESTSKAETARRDQWSGIGRVGRMPVSLHLSHFKILHTYYHFSNRFCPFAVIVENPDEKLFTCLRDGCGIVSCRGCKKVCSSSPLSYLAFYADISCV